MDARRAPELTVTEGSQDKPEPARSRVPAETLRKVYQVALRVRLLERELANLFKQGRLAGWIYPSTGGEALAPAAVMTLGAQDWVCPTHRDLGVHLARGMSVLDVAAQYLGGQESPGRGRISGPHQGNLDHGTLPVLGGPASNLAVGAGVALSFKVRGLPHVVLGFFGDGAMNSGAWHEAVNLIADKRLPCVLVCRNNGWAFSTPVAKACAVESAAVRAQGYGLPCETVDGADTESVILACGHAVDRVRAGEGPSMVECVTPRLGGHHAGDGGRYMQLTKGKHHAGHRRDVLERLEWRLIETGLATDTWIQDETRQATEQVRQAVNAAQRMPPPSRLEGLTDVYSGVDVVGNGKTAPLHGMESTHG